MNDSGSTDILYLIDLVGFNGFRVDAYYISVPDTHTSSASVGRRASGDKIYFVFGSGDLSFGKDSEQLVLHTDATSYGSRQATVNGYLSGKSETVTTYGPTTIPEPGTSVLMVTCTFSMIRRRA